MLFTATLDSNFRKSSLFFAACGGKPCVSILKFMSEIEKEKRFGIGPSHFSAVIEIERRK